MILLEDIYDSQPESYMASDMPVMGNAPSCPSTPCSDTDNGRDYNSAISTLESTERMRNSTSSQGHSTYDDAGPRVTPGSKNVVVFGPRGAGKSSVINLIAGKELAKASAGLKSCTLEAKKYTIILSEETKLHIFDTAGLEEPELGLRPFLDTAKKAHRLVKRLHSSGGIDLLLFCIPGQRITTALQRSYRLFYEVLCESQVPLAVVVTHLENETNMESWWGKNKKELAKYEIHTTNHACITAVPARITAHAQKREESQQTLQKMLLDTLSKPNHRYLQEMRIWFAHIMQLLLSLLKKDETPQAEDLVERLKKRCNLKDDYAQELAQILADRSSRDTVPAAA